MSTESDLQKLREKIDSIDANLLNLISQRAKCAEEVAKVKIVAGQQGSFYRPEREAQVLRKVMENNPGPLADEQVARLFRELMSACLALEEPQKIAFLGPQGTFTQAAVLKHFGQFVDSLPKRGIGDVFREVESGTADYGVVPVENSTEGVVNHTLDMFLQSPLHICGEVQIRIHHHLMSKAPDMAGIKRIYSHQQSFAQCRRWLDQNLAGIERITVSSNGEAANLATTDTESAAIGGRVAADIYELPLLASNIEDESNNTTRFLVIGRDSIAPSGKDKTSLMIASPNKPGSLFRLLSPMANHGLSMTRIESRPSRRGMWDYVFFIDIEGHASDPAAVEALNELEAQSNLFRVLGSYPKGII